MKVKCIYNKGDEDRLTIRKVYDINVEQFDINGKCGMCFYCIINTDYGDSFAFQTRKFEIIEE